MKTILVIEDETQTRKILLNCLRFEGFHALEADNGITGIKLAQTHQPDLIICDIMMAEMDGYQVISALRQQSSTATIPLIFLTAKVSLFELRLGMELGADDYLTKPCTVEQFLAAITARLKRQEQLKEVYSNNSKILSTSTTIFPNCPRLNVVFNFIEHYYFQSIRLQDVAQAVGYSPAYLTNLMQELTGRTVKQWIIERRMFHARELLLNTEQSITQIAEATGYLDTGYFIRKFRQLHGISPQVWRKNSHAYLDN
ncbi:two component transcriptional regulator, AraC family [Stanieria sp. NIES-3757]|nr:two component transcriptional regulator, AraC family [Stanieria sp. NIES-3757]